MFWILNLIALFSFERMINASSYEQCKKEISVETVAPIHMEYSYPIFSGKSTLIEQVNRHLKSEAEDCFNCCAKTTEEDECTLSYELFPIYQTANLISIYECNFQCRDGCHGCSYYQGKNFWQKGNSVVKLVLDDLFIKGSGYRQFLLDYCENFFKTSGYGYYSSRSEFPPRLDLKDLDTFCLTDKGVIIIFRAYTVGGWADGPDTVFIPYTKLKRYIDPRGPLKEMIQ
jgi:hypothetical protein